MPHEKEPGTFLFGVAHYDKSYPIQLPIILKHMLSQGARGKYYIYSTLYCMQY